LQASSLVRSRTATQNKNNIYIYIYIYHIVLIKTKVFLFPPLLIEILNHWGYSLEVTISKGLILVRAFQKNSLVATLVALGMNDFRCSLFFLAYLIVWWIISFSKINFLQLLSFYWLTTLSWCTQKTLRECFFLLDQGEMSAPSKREILQDIILTL